MHRLPARSLARPAVSVLPTRRAFTLVELLVVIGIIVILMAILLPVAGRVRIQAQSTRTAATMSAIAAAIERYYNDERSYPGLFSNTQINVTPSLLPTSFANLTSSENLVLSLVGGVEPDTNGAPSTFNAANMGKGPMNFSSSPIYRVRRGAYIEASPGTLLPQPGTNSGQASANMDVPGVVMGIDSPIPEFQDNYGAARPILYLKANVGVPSSVKVVCNPITDSAGPTQAQYPYGTLDLHKYQRGPAPDINGFPGDFVWKSTATDYEFYTDENDYLKNVSTSTTAKFEPRGKDKYILISAGADRVFGTKDDIFIGGN